MSEDYITGQIEMPGPVSGIGGPRGGRLDLNPLVLASVTYAADTAALKIVATGTMPGSVVLGQTGGLVGLQVETTPIGDVTHCNGRRVAGVYSVLHLAGANLPGITEIVTGTSAAGEFELDITSLGDCPYEVTTLCLRPNNTSGINYHADASFIRIRDAGTALMPNLFRFVRAAGAWDSTEVVRTSTTPKAATHAIKCRLAGADFWLIATTLAPTD